MPVRITKVKGGYRVSTPNMVHAKCTTLANAKKQAKIINAADHGVKLSGRRKR